VLGSASKLASSIRSLMTSVSIVLIAGDRKPLGLSLRCWFGVNPQWRRNRWSGHNLCMRRYISSSTNKRATSGGHEDRDGQAAHRLRQARLRATWKRRCARRISRWESRRPRAEIFPWRPSSSWGHARIVLELFYARTEPLISIVVIVGDARAETSRKEKPGCSIPCLMSSVRCFCSALVPAGDEGGACGQSEGNGVDRASMLPKGMLFVFMPTRLVGRRLAGGQAIDLVVHDDVEQIHIAAHRMNEVVAADPETVTVAARHQHGEFIDWQASVQWPRRGRAMQSVHAVGIHVSGSWRSSRCR